MPSPHEKRRHEHIKSASAFFLASETWTLLESTGIKVGARAVFGAGISYILLIRQSKASEADKRSLSAFFISFYEPVNDSKP